MLETLRKNEKYHLIIFASVFIYFLVLKLLGYVVMPWLILFSPILALLFLYVLIKVLKKYKRNCKIKH